MDTCNIKRCTRIFLIISALVATTVDAGGRRSSSDLLSASTSTSTSSSTARTTSVQSFAATAEASLPTCDVDAITATGPALVFHDPALLASDFAFRAAVQKIIDTSNATSATSPEAFVSTMLNSYLASERTNVDANLRTPVDVRTGEASMDPTALVNGMIPIAVFNRFDLTPTDGSICGEHRIVYAKPDGAAGLPSGRFLVILEAAYPNPSPSQGLAGCIPVASFWAGLANPALTDAARVGLLRDFFFNGITQDGVALPPVIAFENFRGSLGQIRTNNFINDVDWQLREFRTGISGSGSAELVVDTIKTNPRAEFYNIDFIDSLDPTQFSNVRAAFRTDFLAKQISNLVAPESAGLTDPVAIINAIGVNIANQFNEFQATSQGHSDKPAAQIDATFRSDIQNSPVLTGLSLTDVHVINRAGATTCGGCHRFSRDEPISPALNWPADAGFVHVTELGDLSLALQNSFLPARERVLENFVCNPPPPAPRMQVGKAKINGGAWTQINFSQTFATPPAVFITPGSPGTTPCDTRVRNVTATGFETTCVEPPDQDGLHGGMTVPFLAIEPGEFTVDGKGIEVSCHTVSAVQGKNSPSVPKSWGNISFSQAFNSPPTVLAEILSDANNVLQGNPPTAPAVWMTPAMRNVTTTGFQTALDLSSVPATSVVPETVCYAAFEKGSLNFLDSSGATARCVADTGSFRGWGNACQSHVLSEPFAVAPLAIGSMNTRSNSDGGWARTKCASTATAIKFVVDEDTVGDLERSRGFEGIGFLACERAFSN